MRRRRKLGAACVLPDRGTVGAFVTKLPVAENQPGSTTLELTTLVDSSRLPSPLGRERLGTEGHFALAEGEVVHHANGIDQGLHQFFVLFDGGAQGIELGVLGAE